MAKTYEAGGATCLSVLTDEEFFGGSVADLQAAASGVRVCRCCARTSPVSPFDVADARLMGADCVLLIAAAMRPCMLADLHALGVDLGLDVLVEIHDELELESALHADATMIGVNQRDLYTFEVDHARAVRMAKEIPDGVVQGRRVGGARRRRRAQPARRRLRRDPGRRDARHRRRPANDDRTPPPVAVVLGAWLPNGAWRRSAANALSASDVLLGTVLLACS